QALEASATAGDVPESLFNKIVEQEKAKVDRLVSTKGSKSPYVLHQQMGDELTSAVTVVKAEKRMLQAYDRLRELKQQYQTDLQISDTGFWTNQTVSFARALWDMM